MRSRRPTSSCERPASRSSGPARPRPGAYVACPTYATYELRLAARRLVLRGRDGRGRRVRLRRRVPRLGGAHADRARRQGRARDRARPARRRGAARAAAADALHARRRRGARRGRRLAELPARRLRHLAVGGRPATATASLARTLDAGHPRSPRATSRRPGGCPATTAGRSSATASTARPSQRSPPGSRPRGGCSATERIAAEAGAVRARLFGALIRGGRAAQGPRGRSRRREPALGDRAVRAARRSTIRAPGRPSTAVASDLVGPTGGVRRYLGDTFYGGGEWTLLTAWLGWERVLAGDREGYLECKGWVARGRATAWQRAARAAHGGATGSRHGRAVGRALGPGCDAVAVVARDVAPDGARRRGRRMELIPRARIRAGGCDRDRDRRRGWRLRLEVRHLARVVAWASRVRRDASRACRPSARWLRRRRGRGDGAASTAFDVLERPLDRLRYGFALRLRGRSRAATASRCMHVACT